jgi:hypothetical protein
VYLSYNYFASPVKTGDRLREFIPIKTPEDVEYIDYICEPDRMRSSGPSSPAT